MRQSNGWFNMQSLQGRQGANAGPSIFRQAETREFGYALGGLPLLFEPADFQSCRGNAHEEVDRSASEHALARNLKLHAPTRDPRESSLASTHGALLVRPEALAQSLLQHLAGTVLGQIRF